MARRSSKKRSDVRKSKSSRTTSPNLRDLKPANRDSKFSSEKREEFLASLRETCNVTQSAEQCGISRRYIYYLMDSDPEFEKLVEAAVKRGVSSLEDEARRRATGYDEDVYFKGRLAGKVRKYSDILLIFLLKAHKPEIYRDKFELPAVNPDDAKRVAEARTVLKRLNTDELSTIATVMEKATTRAVAQAVGVNGKRTLQ